MKRLIAFALVLIMVLTLCATAFAATKPSVSIDKKYQNQTIKRGKTIKWAYKLNPGSYKLKNGYYRSRLFAWICKGSKNGVLVTEPYLYDFYGKHTFTLQWKVPKKTAKGKYVHVFGTAYRKNGSDSWRIAKTKTSKITVK